MFLTSCLVPKKLTKLLWVHCRFMRRDMTKIRRLTKLCHSTTALFHQAKIATCTPSRNVSGPQSQQMEPLDHMPSGTFKWNVPLPAERAQEAQTVKTILYKGGVQAASLIVRSGFASSHAKALAPRCFVLSLLMWARLDHLRSISFLSLASLMSL